MKTIALVLFAAIALSGCSTQDFEGSPCHDKIAPDPWPWAPRHLTADHSGFHPLEFILSASSTPGDDVRMRLTIRNKSLESRHTMSLKGGYPGESPEFPFFSLVVTSEAPGCYIVARRILDGWLGRGMTLEPGREEVLLGAWNRKYHLANEHIPPGEYLLHAILHVRWPEEADLVVFKRLTITGEPGKGAVDEIDDWAVFGPPPECGAVPAGEHALEVLDRHRERIHRLPSVWSSGMGILRDEDNNRIDGTRGIIIGASRRIDQSALPAEDRIPDCLEGVPVQYEKHPPEWPWRSQ